MAAALAASLALSGCERPVECDQERGCVMPEPRPDGEPCSDDRDCEGGTCLLVSGAGLCATGCSSASDCPDRRCAPAVDEREGGRLRLVCGPARGDRFHAETCARDDECRPGLCHQGRCSSPCGECPTDFACRPATLSREGGSLDHGVCTWWPLQPVVELGGVSTSEGGPSAASFELPAGYGAFTLVLEDFDGLIPAVTRLSGPDGTVFIGQPGDGGTGDLARCSSSAGIATVLVPGSDQARAALRAGRYQLEVVTYEAAGFPLAPKRVAGGIDRVAAVLKRPVRGGVVDLSLHLAPETGYSVADGGGSWVRALLGGFEQVTRGKLGVAVGEVRLQHLPADAGVVVSSVAESRALWSAHAAGEPTSRLVNVVVVDQLAFAGGVSGAVPGPPGVYLGPASGVTLAPLTSGPAATGVLMAHEVLHFLGLFHTSDEFYGPDLVSDTPSCADPSGTGCPDARNLLFPYFPTREPLTLTEGQVRVLEGSPWVYQRLHPGACGAHEVVSLGPSRFAGGSTVGAPATLAGACGGAGAERVHLLRLDAPAGTLEATVRGSGFNPILYVRRAECGPDARELACAVGDGGVATAAVADAGPGAYFFVVDSPADGGTFTLDVSVTQ